MRKVLIIISVLVANQLAFSQNNKIIDSIPFELFGEHIFIKVKVNSSKNLDFIFDTGAAGAVINNLIAEKIQLQKKKTSTSTGAGGKTEVDKFKKNRLKINNTTLDDVTFYGTPLDHLERSIGRNIDGIIGYTLLKDYAVKVNYDNMMLEIYPQKKFVYKGDGKKIKIKSIFGLSGMFAQVTFNNGDTFKGEYLIDSGAGLTLAFCKPTSEKEQLKSKLEKQYMVETKGLTTDEICTVSGKVKNVQLNDFIFENVPVSLEYADAGVFSWKIIDGIIGNELLKRFNITYNYKKKETYWEPNKHYNDDFKINCLST